MSAADQFLRLACVDYERWRFTDAAKAERMLSDDPALARTNIWTAAAAGDVEGMRAILDRDHALVNAKGGPFGWEPLLYACYSRVGSTLDVARLLLERGADPNARYLWYGNLPPFTALTGAFGEGEDRVNQTPHPDRDALARLLLDAGADPNDGQTLYNRHFGPDDGHLRLLLEYGLSDPELLAEELWSAARKNFFERVKLLVAHGVDVNTPGVRDGRTPYEAAIRAGNQEIADYLAAHGAERTPLNPRERLAAACIAGRRDEALAMRDVLDALSPHERIELVHRAVEAKRPEGVRLLAELGFDISGRTMHDSVGINLAASPLHNATGDLAMVQLLIELGADPDARDRTYHATPLEWALHMRQWDVAAYLFPRTKDIDLDARIERAKDEGDAELENVLHALRTR
jgi:ankyrin repeat protein